MVDVTPSRLEIAVAVSLLLLGAFAAWEAARMPFGTRRLPGPGMMPMALGVLLMLSLAGLVVLELKAPADGGRRDPLGHRHVALDGGARSWRGLLFERAGFLITSTLFLFVMLVGAVAARLVARRCWRRWRRASPPATCSRTCSASTLPPLPFS